ncbi:MAG: hypothetical protein QM539_10920 [Alphaproteobacteria bacterium]|nr:hypothetical protein [Alphaproteobacteria bacterium]
MKKFSNSLFSVLLVKNYYEYKSGKPNSLKLKLKRFFVILLECFVLITLIIFMSNKNCKGDYYVVFKNDSMILKSLAFFTFLIAFYIRVYIIYHARKDKDDIIWKIYEFYLNYTTKPLTCVKKFSLDRRNLNNFRRFSNLFYIISKYGAVVLTFLAILDFVIQIQQIVEYFKHDENLHLFIGLRILMLYQMIETFNLLIYGVLYICLYMLAIIFRLKSIVRYFETLLIIEENLKVNIIILNKRFNSVLNLISRTDELFKNLFIAYYLAMPVIYGILFLITFNLNEGMKEVEIVYVSSIIIGWFICNGIAAYLCYEVVFLELAHF